MKCFATCTSKPNLPCVTSLLSCYSTALSSFIRTTMSPSCTKQIPPTTVSCYAVSHPIFSMASIYIWRAGWRCHQLAVLRWFTSSVNFRLSPSLPCKYHSFTSALYLSLAVLNEPSQSGVAANNIQEELPPLVVHCFTDYKTDVTDDQHQIYRAHPA